MFSLPEGVFAIGNKHPHNCRRKNTDIIYYVSLSHRRASHPAVIQQWVSTVCECEVENPHGGKIALQAGTGNHQFPLCLLPWYSWNRYLQALGYDIPSFHPSEHTHHKPQFLNHTLAVNDFLIAASLLPSSAPDIAVVDIRHDLTLKRTSQPVIPDGWIDFRINQHTQVWNGAKEKGCSKPLKSQSLNW
jgi:hypothetical protein